jgi:hypothetical protein
MSDFIPLEKDPKWSAFNDYTWESFQKTYLPKVALISTVHPRSSQAISCDQKVNCS